MAPLRSRVATLSIAVVAALAACGGSHRSSESPLLPECTPACKDRQCGDDRCGGSCGKCADGQACSLAGQCVAGAGTVTGTLSFEARIADLSSQGVISLQRLISIPGAALPVAVTAPDRTTLGTGVTDASGAFRITLNRALTGDESLLVAALWAPSGGATTLAVLRPHDGGTPGRIDAPAWAWSAKLPVDGNIGNVEIREQDGSGALYLLTLAASAIRMVTDDMLDGDPGRVATLAVLWAPDVAWSCGACFAAGLPQRIGGGGPAMMHSIFVGGEADSSSAWGNSVVLHEFGHYVAHSYSRDDSPGGRHTIGETLVAPFAWSEGWASFFSVCTMSRWAGKADPLFWDIQHGTSFWVDLAAGQYANGFVVRPDPAGGIEQYLDENWVAVMLWHLWNGTEVPEQRPDDDGTSLGTPAVVHALASPRLLDDDRGAHGVDFVDFVDAVICADPAQAANVTSTVTGYLGFPYDGAPLCR